MQGGRPADAGVDTEEGEEQLVKPLGVELNHLKRLAGNGDRDAGELSGFRAPGHGLPPQLPQ